MGDLKIANWSFRIFREENSTGVLKYGLKRVYFNESGEVVDWDKDFHVYNDYESVGRMKKALEGMILDIEEHKLVLSNKFLYDMYDEAKDKMLGGSGDIIEVDCEEVLDDSSVKTPFRIEEKSILNM